MKFKVESRDLAIFACFCIFLFYLCCIVVLNISTLSAEGHFYGLLPFKAFTPQFFPATLLLFIIALVGIFTSVSS